jgi:hypothetical protein
MNAITSFFFAVAARITSIVYNTVFTEQQRRERSKRDFERRLLAQDPHLRAQLRAAAGCVLTAEDRQLLSRRRTCWR